MNKAKTILVNKKFCFVDKIILHLHIINKSEINIYKSKNVVEKLAITKKRLSCCKKKEKEDLLFLKGSLLFTVYDRPLLDKVQ